VLDTTKILALERSWLPNFIHFKLRSRSPKFWNGRRRTVYLRLRNPGFRPWFLSKVSRQIFQTTIFYGTIDDIRLYWTQKSFGEGGSSKFSFLAPLRCYQIFNVRDTQCWKNQWKVCYYV